MAHQPDGWFERPQANALQAVRRILLAALGLGTAGTAAELLLLGHFEDWRQTLPLALLAATLVVLAWHAIDRRGIPVRALQLVMLSCILSGAIGLVFHYRGNVEFELEMYPSRDGIELIRKAMTGATPVLAPGTMMLLGLVGLAYAYDHPRLNASAAEPTER